MKRILLAALLFAMPVLAHGRGYDDGYDSGYGDDPGQSWDDVAYGDDAPGIDDFRNDAELSWNGEWVETPEYGSVWRPRHVSDDWQPYLYGRWVWTDAGWTWASDEPFGWAVYHYGRWTWAPALGWMWIPGRVWAPAWVSWRWTDGYAAWCPMGAAAARPAFWVVVPSGRFLEPVRHNVVPLRQRATIPLPPREATRAGPPVAVVERATGRAVRPLAVQNVVPARVVPRSGGYERPRAAVPIASPRPTASAVPRPGASPRAIATPPPAPAGARIAPAPRVTAAPHASAPRASVGEHAQAKER